MKLTSAKINPYIKNLPKELRAALVYGADLGLASVLIREIKKSYLGNNYSVSDIIEIDSAILKKNPEKLAEEAFSMSLLGAANKVILLKSATASITPIIKEYLAKPDDYTLLVVEAEDLPVNNSLRKLFEAQDNAVAIPCYHDSSSSLEATIKQILSVNNYKIEPAALAWLLNHLGNDRLITEQELNKLMLYKGNNLHITFNDVTNIIGDNTDLALTKIIFDTFSGNSLKASISLNQIKDDIPEIAIIRALNSHLRKLLTSQIIIEQERISIADAVAKIKPPVLFMYVEAFKGHLRLWSLARINRYMQKLNELEFKTKNNPSIATTLLSHLMLEIDIELNKKLLTT